MNLVQGRYHRRSWWLEQSEHKREGEQRSGTRAGERMGAGLRQGVGFQGVMGARRLESRRMMGLDSHFEQQLLVVGCQGSGRWQVMVEAWAGLESVGFAKTEGMGPCWGAQHVTLSV